MGSGLGIEFGYWDWGMGLGIGIGDLDWGLGISTFCFDANEIHPIIAYYDRAFIILL